MHTNFIVSYDLISPGPHYQQVAEAIKSLGPSIKPLESFWYVCSAYSIEEVTQIIWESMDKDDKLFVVETADTAWCNLPPAVNAFLLEGAVTGDCSVCAPLLPQQGDVAQG